MKKVAIWSAVLTAMVLAGCAQPGAGKSASVSEEELGLRTAPIYDEAVALNQPIDYMGKDPGSGERFERSFENAPPMIPHSVEGLLPITTANNTCVGCHMPEVASAVGAVAVPHSHLFDLRNDKDLGGQLSNARFNCSQCHAPQVDRDPAVQNRFSAAWRTREGMEKSNLMQVIKEGVR